MRLTHVITEKRNEHKLRKTDNLYGRIMIQKFLDIFEIFHKVKIGMLR